MIGILDVEKMNNLIETLKLLSNQIKDNVIGLQESLEQFKTLNLDFSFMFKDLTSQETNLTTMKNLIDNYVLFLEQIPKKYIMQEEMSKTILGGKKYE